MERRSDSFVLSCTPSSPGVVVETTVTIKAHYDRGRGIVEVTIVDNPEMHRVIADLRRSSAAVSTQPLGSTTRTLEPSPDKKEE